MTPLPYIDEHSVVVTASAERVWRALVVTLGKTLPRLPGWLVAAWGLGYPRRSGNWDGTPAVGDTVPGFAAAEVAPERRLVLRGSHRFSDYELAFDLEREGEGTTRLRATSSAAFPGLKGSIYRSLVIGTGGHPIAVRRMLARIAARAGPPDEVAARSRRG